jgi:hypothetical protein
MRNAMSDHDENNGKGFRVVDRRRFNAEGGVRKDAPEREEPKVAPAAPPAEPARSAAPAREAAPRKEPPKSSGPEFLQFVASLATNALAALGALPDGYGPPMPPDPAIARQYIEIIAMLQEKTAGNLTAEEDQTLKRLLSDLKVQYVEATTGGPQAPRGPMPGRPR